MKLLNAALSLCVCLVCFTRPAISGISLDGTFGRAGAITGPNYQITSDMGRQLGGNLFHSFSVFNIDRNESAIFSGPANIINIISRVTSGSTSTIDGMIRSSIVGADFYLINPAGVFFGPNVSIDVPGAFHASTADYLRLSDGGVFHASRPSQGVLTSAPPSAFGFIGTTVSAGNPNRGRIEMDRSFIFNEGRSFSLTAGEVSINNGGIFAVSGDISIIGINSGEINIEDFSLSQSVSLGYVSISDKRPLSERPVIPGLGVIIGNIDVSGTMPGRVLIAADSINMDGSWVQSMNFGEVNAGGIHIHAGRDLSLLNRSSLIASSLGRGRSGEIMLNSPNILFDNSSINSWTYIAEGGDIGINSTNMTIQNSGAIFSSSFDSGRGPDILINAKGIFSMKDEGSIIYSRSKSEGKGGSVSVKARQFIMHGPSSILTSTDEETTGQGGDISVVAEHLDMSGGASIYTSAYGYGTGGAIRIEADKSISLRDSMTGFYAISYAEGNSGGITVTARDILMDNQAIIGSTVEGSGSSGDTFITADRLTIQNGAYIDSSTLGKGRGGNITLNISDSIRISDSLPLGISAISGKEGDAGVINIDANSIVLDHSTISTSSAWTGRGGSISIRTSALTIQNGGYIDSSSFGPGEGGHIDVQADRAIYLYGLESGIHAMSSRSGNAGSINLRTSLLNVDGSLILTNSNGSGKGGNINIESQFINLSDLALISAESNGTGNAGNISITAGLFSGNKGLVRTSSLYSTGGNIQIAARQVQLLGNSAVTATVAKGEGSGGNVTINSETLVSAQGSNITARADQGYGGDITINSQAVILSRDSILDASSNIYGREGRVEINAPTVDIAGNLVKLSSVMMNIEEFKPKICSDKADDMSSFILRGREGLPPIGN